MSMARPILWQAPSLLARARKVRSEIEIPLSAMVAAHWAGVFARSSKCVLDMTGYPAHQKTVKICLVPVLIIMVLLQCENG